MAASLMLVSILRGRAGGGTCVSLMLTILQFDGPFVLLRLPTR